MAELGQRRDGWVGLLISPALAYHGTAGQGTSMSTILPLMIIVAVLAIAIVFLGRKKGRKGKRKSSSRRKKR